MSHNPIIDRKNLTFLSVVNVPPGSTGLIYKSGRLVRRLGPGEQTG